MPRPRYFRPPGSGGGGGGGQQGGSTVTLSKFGEVESLGAGVAAQLEALSIRPALHEVGVQVSARLEQTYTRNAAGVAAALDLIGVGPFARNACGVAASGTLAVGDVPSDEDTNLLQDQPNTGFGSVTELFSRTANAVGDGERHAYIAWDFTDWTGIEPTNGSFQFYGRTTALLTEQGNVQVYTHPTKPFDEANATWNNDEPPPGTLRFTYNNVPFTTSYQSIGLNLPQDVLDNLAGNWVYLRFNGVGALGTTQVVVRSKETLVTAERPYIIAFEANL